MIQASQLAEPGLRELSSEAEAFISSQRWCRKVDEVRLAWATAGVLGVFQVDLVPSQPGVDSTLWVVVGDLPPAYLVLDESPTWREALQGYIAEMSLWVHAVRNSLPLDDIIPVEADASLEHAEMLERRLALIQTEILGASGDGAVRDA